MDKEKEEELIAYLANYGFKGAFLESEIRKKIGLGTPYFSLMHKMDYGDEQMFYDLKFRMDHQFNAYRLERYKATHRKPIGIDHKVINEIDTAKLEERMKKVNWVTHFSHTDKYPENPDDKHIAQIISDLLELDTDNNAEGINIQELLQFKYFSKQAYDDRLKELRSIYDQSREFTATENGLCNAHLAYHIVSGRLEDLYEKLQNLKLDQYPGIDVYVKLETILSDNPDAFELKCFRNEPEGYVEYLVPVSQGDEAYFIDTYTVSLTPYPPIEHGIYNGINTGELEAMMQQVDWHNDRELFIIYEDREPEFLPKVSIIQEQMYRLSQDMVGGDISDKLQLKYWRDASFFKDMVQQTAWDYLESLPKRVQQFPVYMEAKTAFNLLCGRFAINFSPDTSSKEDDTWMRLDLIHKDENGNYPIHTIEGFPSSELEKRLDLLPIDNLGFYSIRNALKRGDLLSVRLKDGRKVMLQANPEQKTINIYTPDMRPIYVNLTLDPDWKPAIPSEKAKELPSHKQEMEQNHFSNHHVKKHKRGRRM